MDRNRKIEIMGIVNITDNSYFSASRCLSEDGKADVRAAMDRIRTMVHDGADIIDIGACSTRPGSQGVGPEVEWQRLEPVLEAVRKEFPELRISVDTYWAEVVRRTYDKIGDFLVNDISAGEDDPQMLPTVGELGLKYVAMHKRGNPRTMDLMTDYPDGVLFLKSSEGRLMYSYNERRIAYFLPGAVSLTLSDKGTETTLFTRNLSAKQVLSVNLSVAGQSSGQDGVKSGISIQLDTARNWVSEDCVIGGEDSGPDGTEVENAMTVAQAKNAAGSQDVWVEGYIVGGDLSSSRCSFLPPFTSRTNLVIASRSSCTDREQCLSVQLAKGSVRDALNLVDHEDYLGRKIWLKGDIVQEYYGIVGIQCITEYRLK